MKENMLGISESFMEMCGRINCEDGEECPFTLVCTQYNCVATSIHECAECLLDTCCKRQKKFSITDVEGNALYTGEVVVLVNPESKMYGQIGVVVKLISPDAVQVRITLSSSVTTSPLNVCSYKSVERGARIW